MRHNAAKDRIKVTLVNPPSWFSFNPELSISYPLGLMYLAAALEDRGIEVKIIDFINKRDTSYISKIIKDNPADIFGISMLTNNRYNAFIIVRMIRSLHKNSKMIIFLCKL